MNNLIIIILSILLGGGLGLLIGYKLISLIINKTKEPIVHLFSIMVLLIIVGLVFISKYN